MNIINYIKNAWINRDKGNSSQRPGPVNRPIETKRFNKHLVVNKIEDIYNKQQQNIGLLFEKLVDAGFIVKKNKNDVIEILIELPNSTESKHIRRNKFTFSIAVRLNNTFDLYINDEDKPQWKELTISEHTLISNLTGTVNQIIDIIEKYIISKNT